MQDLKFPPIINFWYRWKDRKKNISSDIIWTFLFINISSFMSPVYNGKKLREVRQTSIAENLETSICGLWFSKSVVTTHLTKNLCLAPWRDFRLPHRIC